MKAIRESRGEDQIAFGVALDAAARQLGHADAPRYASSVVSRIENGLRPLTLDDVQAIARVDPEKRGELWVAYAIAPRKLTAAELDRAVTAANAARAARSPTGKAAGGKGT